MFKKQATDGLAPVAVDGDPATKRKAITGGRIAGIAVFLVGVVATGVVAVTGHHITITNAIVAGLGTIASAVGTGTLTHRGVFAAVNTTSAERGLLAELVPLVKVALPAIFARIQPVEHIVEVPAAPPVEVPVAPAAPVVDTAQVTAAVVAALGPLGPQLADTVQTAILGVIAAPAPSAPVGAVPLGSAS